jgi:hypothetical protein
VASIAIDLHLAIIQIHVGRNVVDDMLLDRGSRTNIIDKDLRKQFGLPSTKPTLYVFRMADHYLTKLIEAIWDFKIHIHGIPYVATFNIMRNNVFLTDLGLQMPR